jgi:hypothetical protein
MHRVDGEGWAFPGGMQKDNETLEECAARECFEETKYVCGGLKHLCCRPGEPKFTTFMNECPDEFTPHLNHEHDSFVWVRPDAAEHLQMHPGCHIALRCAAGPLNELQLAEAIRDRELVSPQKIEHVLLVAMRVSGTGFSYRPGLNEWVFRREDIYLTPEFLARCNGIPIIYDHPSSKILDSAEFNRRVVGTSQLPYLEGNEVWTIARIYDANTVQDIVDGQLSTSPSVVFRDPKVNYTIELDGGDTLLIEGSPSFIDHLAICKKGVWDKMEEPSGIRIDSESSGDPQEQVVTAKLDVGEVPAPDLPLMGAGAPPAPAMQSIPPNLMDFVSGINTLADRLDKFMLRRDLMVR